MNLRADELGLVMTRYSNPHGLQNAMNLSTAKDILTLSVEAAKNREFKRVMNARIHRYYLYRVEESRTMRELKMWENKNVLLGEGW
jgi:D-alanyl-D-alanine carboxypeptidase